MYLQQMLCVIAPCRDVDPHARLQAARDDLDAALSTLGYVHFASFALLPPSPPATLPSLMLELAVDDGIDPARSVGDFIDAAAPAIWPLYRSANGGPTPSVDAMRRSLRDLLLPSIDHARPAGGFIGMRDRTVAQIGAEQDYFLAAREHMIRIRDSARTRPPATPAAPAELVDELVATLAADPAHVAMRSPPPHSFWCKPRSPLLQLLMALVWAVLPVPALLCAIATVGVLADALTPHTVPAGSGLFGLGIAAVLSFLLAIVLIWALMRKGGISMLVFFVVISVAGFIAFYAVLAGDYAMVANAKHVAPWLRPWAALDLAVAGGLILVWAIAQLLGNAVTRGVMTVSAIAGAAVTVMMLATAARGTMHLCSAVSWPALFYYLPGALALWLIASSVIARWVLAVGLALTLVLLPLVHYVAPVIPATWRHDLLTVGPLTSELIYLSLGVLALVGVPLLLAIAGALLAFARLASPRAPLGIPLAVVLAVSVGLALLLGWGGDWLFFHLHPALRATWPRAPSAWVCGACLLVVAGLVFWALRGLASGLIPDIMRFESALDQPAPGSGGHFRPCVAHESIAANEASLAGGPSHMISVTDVRGWQAWMWRLAWVFLHVVGQIGHAWFTKGLLATASGIKFAHWHLIDGGRRLLFVSNFDGDFGGYLDQFILGASEGINLVWRWTRLDRRPATLAGQPAVPFARKFPPTRRLSFLGCRHEQHFKAYARASMVPHLYLYQAYKLSNDDIQRATRLRAALLGERTTEKDDLVLRILES